MSESQTQNHDGPISPIERRACGRRAVVDVVDLILARQHNVQKLKEDMQAAFDENAIEFVMNIAMPMMPRDMFVDRSEVASSDQIAASIVSTVADMSNVTMGIPLGGEILENLDKDRDDQGDEP